MHRLALLLALSFAPSVLADLIISEEDVCRGLKPGASCRASLSEGVCTQSTCTRNDYSEGVPPKQKVVECLKCVPKSATTPDAGTRPVKKTKAR